VAFSAIGTLGWWLVTAIRGGEHYEDSTVFLLAFSIILVAAKVGGEIFERLNQPAVLGELVCGIVLGNLSLVRIDVFELLKEAPFLAIAAEVGVILLLFEVGLECDLDELLAVGPSAIVVASVGVASPIALGFCASWVFMPEDAAWYVHLFVGATLSATSVGITARVLQDMGKTQSPESKVILGAAIVDDILGLIVLAFVLGLVDSADAGAGTEFSFLPILLIIAKAAGFLAGSMLMSRTVIVPLIAIIQRAKSKSVPVVLSVAYCFVMSALADMIGLADIVGAFAAGLVVDRAITRHFGEESPKYRISDSIRPITSVFVPVFFVYMGLRVDLHSFAFVEVLVFAAVLALVAIVSKQVCSLGVLEKGLNRWAVGVGMIPRGEVGLIFAGVGSTVMVAGVPVFSAETFSSVVAMVMLTTLATPPLLKAVFANEPGGSKSRQTRLFPELGKRGPKSAAATRRSPRSESRDY
jgi:Kef-type K+ transport system membrane component KefB